ncbi:mas-related G-protein coupled receptor member X1-like [Petaurus breviceps papuanus]|uniref:mas-related G-protein coupled receptor member X1-like n=1 Tax=Petaurus breviceps papuanus TaxID=3040969 RepID=UPI0036D9FE32
MDLITWDLSSPQLPWELDYDKRAVPTSWAEEAAPQRALLPLPSLTVLIDSWGVIGNSIVLWLLGFQIKRGPFAIYTLNMTTASFFFLPGHILNIVGQLLFSLDSNRVFSWYHRDCPKHASAIASSLIWVLTAFSSGTGYFLCKYPSSSNGCKEFLQSSQIWLLLLFLLYVVTLTLLFCSQCSRCQRHRCCCPKSPRLWVPAVLIILQLLLHSLPFVIDQFNSEFNVMTLENEDDFNLSHSESDAAIFETEDDIDVLLSCLENSTGPFTYFFLTCCKRRKGRESFRAFLQRTLLEEWELEYGTDMVSGSSGVVTLTLRTQEGLLKSPGGVVLPHEPS